MKNPICNNSMAAGSRRSSLPSIWPVWMLGILVCTGCLGTPHCEPCSNVCSPTPDCFGFYETCWRPWPCPPRCPEYWEEGVQFESIPDPGIPSELPPETSAPVETETPASVERSEPLSMSSFSVGDHPSMMFYSGAQVRFLPVVDTGYNEVSGADWSQATPAAQTPFPSGALGTID